MDFAKDLKHAEEELLKLEQQKVVIERQMRGWIQVIEGLRVLNSKERFSFDDPPPTREECVAEMETPSLPATVFAVLLQAGGPIPAPQIRDQLVASRAVDASAKNLLINIHTTLKRLIKTGQVEELPFSETTKLYRAISPMEQAIKMPRPGLSWEPVYASGMRGDETPKTLSHNFRPTPVVDVSKKK